MISERILSETESDKELIQVARDGFAFGEINVNNNRLVLPRMNGETTPTSCTRSEKNSYREAQNRDVLF